MTEGRPADMIFVVVVTFNRLHLLQQAIASVQAQTYGHFKIVVVNNGCTDGTAEWLTKQTGLLTIYQPNAGSAGGYHTGVQYAYNAGAVWVWMLDDDVAPDKDCLANLLIHQSVSVCLHPVHVYDNGEMQEEERWFNPVDCRFINYFNASFKAGKAIWYRNTGSFEGMLINREIIAKIGFPDRRFFTYHDDAVYGYLAHKHTNVSVVADAIIRKLPVQKSVSSSYAYLYYSYRNLWLLEEYAAKDVAAITGYRKRRIRLQFLYAVYKIYKWKEYPNQRNAISTLWKAYRDYRKKKEGRTFP